jgi:hypothetical protein
MLAEIVRVIVPLIISRNMKGTSNIHQLLPVLFRLFLAHKQRPFIIKVLTQHVIQFHRQLSLHIFTSSHVYALLLEQSSKFGR